jgi:hypothetical protein
MLNNLPFVSWSLDAGIIQGQRRVSRLRTA